MAFDGVEGLLQIETDPPDLIICDVMMPRMDGLELCNKVRGDTATDAIPFIFLTARTEKLETLEGFQMGADDYIAKPFNPRELLARIKAVLRRSQVSVFEGKKEDINAVGIHMNTSRREVRIDDNLVELTTMEFDILRTLLSRAGRVVTRDLLMEELRGQEWDVYDRSIDVHISHLRKKIGDDSKRPTKIKTIRGVGYLVPN